MHLSTLENSEDILARIDKLKVRGAGLFAIDVSISGIQLGKATFDGNASGVAKSSADIAINGIAATGTPVGLAVGLGYLLFDNFIGINSLVPPTVTFFEHQEKAMIPRRELIENPYY